MAKRVFIIHGWEGHPGESWFPWLKQQLESKGYDTHVPAMPDTEHPKISAWVPTLKQQIGTPDEHTYLIGHSIGCQTIMRYLQSLPDDARVGGVIFVGGWVTLKPATFDEEGVEDIARPWMDTPLNWDAIKAKTDHFIAIFSDNDPFVPLSDANVFKEHLNAKIIIQKGQGHFSDDTSDNAKQLPIILEELERIS